MKATENGATIGTKNGPDERKIDIVTGIEKGDEMTEKTENTLLLANGMMIVLKARTITATTTDKETAKSEIETRTETAKTTDGIEIVTAIVTGATTGAIRIVTAIKTSEISGIATVTKTSEIIETVEAKIEETKVVVIVTGTATGTGTTIEEVLRAGAMSLSIATCLLVAAGTTQREHVRETETGIGEYGGTFEF